MNGQVRIEQMFAFVVMDDDDTEGIPAFEAPGGLMMPLVGADVDRAKSLQGIAQDFADQNGKEVTLVVFSQREEVETIKPRNRP